MLTYDLANANVSLYLHLYNCIKEDILKGKILAGEKLPSKRTFARNNGISIITVQNAYDQLISEGYIYTIPKKGYYVSSIDGMNLFNSRKSDVSYDIRIPVEKKMEYDLSNNRIDPSNFPFSVWTKISRSVMTNYEKELMETAPTGGIKDLREAIANHLQSFRGMLVDPNQIIIGAGTEYLYGLLVQLLGNNLKYVVENPGYKKLAKIYEQYGVEYNYVDMDEKGVSAAALSLIGADIAHISPNHHFPTGITMPISRRYEILSWAAGSDNRYVIEDDYDSEFRASGKPIPTMFSIDGQGKVIYMNTFSKSLSTTIRISYMVLPVELANLFYEKLSFYSCTVSNFEQYTLAEFIKQGYFEKHINRMRLHYARKRKNMMNIIENGSLGKVCNVLENDSGLHFLINIKTSLTDAEVKKRLADKKIKIQSLSDYYFSSGEMPQHMFIINYSNVDSESIQEVFNVIEKCIV